MILAHKIALDPTPEQAVYFARACGVSRFAYNWALAEWRRRYKEGEKPNEAKLRKLLNSLKRQQFPWMLEVGKTAPQQAIRNLGIAYKNLFDDLAKLKRGEIKPKEVRRPDFKKKGRHDSFRAENGTASFAIECKRLKLPRVGWVKMREALRFTGRAISVTVSRVADRWFASIQVEIEHMPPVRENQAVVGVDLGVKTLATLSDGTAFPGPKALKANLKRLRRFNRALDRKAKGSANRKKAWMKLARLHARIANIRADAVHKLTTHLVRTYSLIGIEDLNVRGMMKNRSLARAISDIGAGEFRRQLGYKAPMWGSEVVAAPRFFPSSKTCHCCGMVNEALTLADRFWTCAGCLAFHDRDENAAINLEHFARASSARSYACGEISAGDGLEPVVKLASRKQEPSHGMFVHG